MSFLRRLVPQAALIAISILTLQCGSAFIRKADVKDLSKNYEGEYSVRERIDVGNFENLNKGARVKIFFKSTGDYVTVYAYPYSQAREEAVGKNILQLFEQDFPERKFSAQYIEERLAILIEPYTEPKPVRKGRKKK